MTTAAAPSQTFAPDFCIGGAADQLGFGARCGVLEVCIQSYFAIRRLISARVSSLRAPDILRLSRWKRRTMMRAAAILGVCILSSNPALADAAFDKCMNAARSNFDFDKCGKAVLTRDDERLNAVWKQVLNLALDPARKDLLEEQRSWLKFRDTSCLFYGSRDDFGREGTVIHLPKCRDNIISDRIKTLEGYRGDMSPK